MSGLLLNHKKIVYLQHIILTFSRNQISAASHIITLINQTTRNKRSDLKEFAPTSETFLVS